MSTSGSEQRSNGLAPHQLALLLLLFLGATLLGGGPGGTGDLLVQALGVVLLALLWRSGGWQREAPVWRLGLVLLALPILQLLPLPAALLPEGSPRVVLAGQLTALGLQAPWRWSLDPAATERAIYFLLPALAAAAASMRASAVQARWLAMGLLAYAAASSAFGLLQMADGPESPLRYHAVSNPDSAVGFFANRNHYAGQLAMLVPLLLAAMAALWSRHRRAPLLPKLLPVLLLAVLLALMVVAIGLSGSRAGLVLLALALLLAAPSLLRLRVPGTRRVFAAVLLLAGLATVQFTLVGIVQRLQVDPLEDHRWKFAAMTIEATKDHLPWGTGMGTFTQVIQAYEGDERRSFNINHAHNDYLELLLEGGVAGGLILLVLLATWLRVGWRLWRSRDGDDREHRQLARAAWLGCGLIALHSLVDYPLRTTSALVMTALLFGLAAAAARHDEAT